MLQDSTCSKRKEASGQGWQEHFVNQLAASKTQSVGEAVSQCLSYVTLSNFASVDEMQILHQAAIDVKIQSSNSNLQEDTNDGTHVMGATVAAHHNCTRYSVEQLLNSNAKSISALFLHRLLRFLDGSRHWEEEGEEKVVCEPIEEIMLELGRMVFGHADWTDSTVKWYTEPDHTGTLHPEPKVNIYDVGGFFKKHEDGMDMTLLVVLNDSFAGGGTAFYCHHDDDNDGESVTKLPDRVERAESGTAIIWGAYMKHMGLPITSGQRSIFVGSFDLEENVEDESNV